MMCTKCGLHEGYIKTPGYGLCMGCFDTMVEELTDNIHNASAQDLDEIYLKGMDELGHEEYFPK